MDRLNAFRANQRASRARDPNTAKAEPGARPVFSETKMVEVSGQSLRVGIRRGKSSSPPLVVFNGIGANLSSLNPW